MVVSIDLKYIDLRRAVTKTYAVTNRHATAQLDVPSAKTPFTKKVPKEVAEDGPNRISPRHFVGAKGLNSKTDMGSERAPLNKPGFC